MRRASGRDGWGKALPLVLLAVLLAGCSVGKDAVAQGTDFTFVSPGGKTELFYPAAQRQNLPNLSGDSLQDSAKQIHVSDFAGDIVVLNLWGQWCGPCRSEAPELSSVYDRTRARGVRLLGLDLRDERSAALDFVHANQIAYPSIFDPTGRVLLALNGYPRNVVPSSIVLDRQHRVAAVYLGRITASTLLSELRTLDPTV